MAEYSGACGKGLPSMLARSVPPTFTMGSVMVHRWLPQMATSRSLSLISVWFHATPPARVKPAPR
ncbi:hypothetical protein D3C73_930660 [compost metagenome]